MRAECLRAPRARANCRMIFFFFYIVSAPTREEFQCVIATQTRPLCFLSPSPSLLRLSPFLHPYLSLFPLPVDVAVSVFVPRFLESLLPKHFCSVVSCCCRPICNMRFLHMHYSDKYASNLSYPTPLASVYSPRVSITCTLLTFERAMHPPHTLALPRARCRNEYGLLLVIFYIQIGLTCIGGFLSFLIILGISSLQYLPSLLAPFLWKRALRCLLFLLYPCTHSPPRSL